MSDILLTNENLQRGISKRKKDHAHWDLDFHNRLYSELYSMRTKGINAEYWGFLVDQLAVWRATRGSSKLEIYQRGLTQLSALGHYIRLIIEKHLGYEPDITMVNWKEIQPLFNLAFYIKKTINQSPVFASKLCHFIFPNIFMVTDNEVIGAADDLDDYRDYWEDCQEDWTSCTTKIELISILGNDIGPDLIENYPFATKITELCIIGSK